MIEYDDELIKLIEKFDDNLGIQQASIKDWK